MRAEVEAPLNALWRVYPHVTHELSKLPQLKRRVAVVIILPKHELNLGARDRQPELLQCCPQLVRVDGARVVHVIPLEGGEHLGLDLDAHQPR